MIDLIMTEVQKQDFKNNKKHMYYKNNYNLQNKRKKIMLILKSWKIQQINLLNKNIRKMD